jgi:hypothetical protein
LCGDGALPRFSRAKYRHHTSRLAKEDGVSLNQWIAAAVAEKVGVVETAADFFKKWTGKATGEGLVRFLRTAPKATHDAEDTL